MTTSTAPLIGDFSGELAETEMVRQSLRALTPRQRACLLLRTRDGLSIDEICDVYEHVARRGQGHAVSWQGTLPHSLSRTGA